MTAGDPLEALTARCGTCGGISEVTWCPAWDAHLCVLCRAARNDAELRIPLAVKDAMRVAAEAAA